VKRRSQAKGGAGAAEVEAAMRTNDSRAGGSSFIPGLLDGAGF
jgi:hypothetical protein